MARTRPAVKKRGGAVTSVGRTDQPPTDGNYALSQSPPLRSGTATVPNGLVLSSEKTQKPKELWHTSVVPSNGLDTPNFRVTGIRFVAGWKWNAQVQPEPLFTTDCEVKTLSNGEELRGTLESYLEGNYSLTREEFPDVAANLLRLLWKAGNRSDRKHIPSECLESVYRDIAIAVQLTHRVWPTFDEWQFVSRLGASFKATELYVWFLHDCYKAHPNIRSKILRELPKSEYAGNDASKSIDRLGQFWVWANMEKDADAERTLLDILLDVGTRKNVWPNFEDKQSEIFAKHLPANAGVQFRRFEKREYAKFLRAQAMPTSNRSLRLKAVQKLYENELEEKLSEEGKLEFVEDILASLPTAWQFKRNPKLKCDPHGLALDPSEVPVLRRWLKKKRREYASSEQPGKKAEPQLVFGSVWVGESDEYHRRLHDWLMNHWCKYDDHAKKFTWLSIPMDFGFLIARIDQFLRPKPRWNLLSNEWLFLNPKNKNESPKSRTDKQIRGWYNKHTSKTPPKYTKQLDTLPLP